MSWFTQSLKRDFPDLLKTLNTSKRVRVAEEKDDREDQSQADESDYTASINNEDKHQGIQSNIDYKSGSPFAFKLVVDREKTSHMPAFDKVNYDGHFRIKSLYPDKKADLILSNIELTACFEKLLHRYVDKLHPKAIVCYSISHPGLEQGFNYNQLWQNFSVNEMLNQLIGVFNSNEEFNLDTDMTFRLRVSRNLQGGIAHRPHVWTPNNAGKNHREMKSVYTIETKTPICGYMALAIGKWYCDLDENCSAGEKGREWGRIRTQKPSARETIVTEFCVEYFDAHPQDLDPLSLSDIANLQERWQSQYQIVVVNANTRGKIYAGPVNSRRICLAWIPPPDSRSFGHYDLILRLDPYMTDTINEQFCTSCWLPYRPGRYHKCKDACRRCNRPGRTCNRTESLITCRTCNLQYFGKSCLDGHKCRSRVCGSCGVRYQKERGHECNVFHCASCNTKYTETPHYCYIQPKSLKKIIQRDQRNNIICAFDIETRCDDSHVPVLLVAKFACSCCYDHINKVKDCNDCKFCGPDIIEFWGSQACDDFCAYLFNTTRHIARQQFAKITVIAHNASGFDNHFILPYVYGNNLKVTRDPILKGTKIIRMEVGEIRFMDSLLFFNMPLSKLPKAYGLTNVMKGDFPFGVLKDWPLDTVTDQWPSIEYYSADWKKPNEKEELQEWLARIPAGTIFDLKKELLQYCHNDAAIVLKVAMEFRWRFEQTTKIDPLSECFTLAGAAFECFRALFLQKETIGITPIEGYAPKRMSKMCEIWLDWVALKKPNSKIAREQRIGQYTADGYDASTNTAYEFYGCYIHGHDCSANRRQNRDRPLPPDNKSMNERLGDVNKKRQYYECRGINLVEKWLCEYRAELCQDQEMKQHNQERLKYYIKIDEVRGGIKIRDALYGGRVENFLFYRNIQPSVDPGDTMSYIDVCSLYPTVLKRNKYPAKHPVVVKSNFHPVTEYFGFVKCKVVAPDNLYVPVLPARIKKKLMFPLCQSCAQQMSQESCKHDEQERAFIGTWPTPELSMAIEMGYKVIEMYEVWHYPESSDMFSSYIDLWFAEKIKASGWPNDIVTREAKEQFLAELERTEGIKLSIDQVEKNDASRSMSKTFLNSLWGKLCQRPDMPRSQICKTAQEYYALYDDPSKRITADVDLDSSTVLVGYTQLYDEDGGETPSSGNTSPAIGAFVTAYARVHLYRVIREIECVRQGRVMYCDTDSIVYHSRPGEPLVKTGSNLGDMTDEVLAFGTDAKMTTFVCCGPKNYSYQIECPDKPPEIVMKAKGMRVGAATADKLDLRTMVEMVTAFTSESQVRTQVQIPQFTIKCCRDLVTLKNIEFSKTYQIVSDKRRIRGNSTLPYGWSDTNESGESTLDAIDIPARPI